MSLSITFSEPTTVNTTGHFLAAGAVYDSGHTSWVYLGFRSPTSVSSCQTSMTGASGTWTMQTMPSSSTWRQIAYASTLGTAGRLVAVGNGVAAYSDDGGVTWAAAVSLPEANNWIDVAWWTAKAIFVAVAGSGTHRVMTSSDGKSWTNQTAASALVWSGIAVSATTAVAVAFSSSASTQLVMTSTDGAAWTLQTHASIKTNRGLVSSGSRLGIGYSSNLDQFLITGTDGSNITYAYYSNNSGVTWAASNTIPTLGNATNRGYFWLSGQASWYMSCADFHYGESTDGVTWTVTSLSTTNSGYTPIAWDATLSAFLGGSTLGFDTVLLGEIKSISSLSPAFGTRHGGTVVRIAGIGLSSVTSVTFGGTAAVSVIASSTEVVCVTPPHASGIFDVVVGGVGTFTNGFTFVSVDRVSPKTGTVEGGTPITITGYGFELLAASQALFDTDAITNFHIVSNTSITGLTPAHAAGLVDVTVTGVDTGANLYTYTLPVPQNLGKGPLLPPIPQRRAVRGAV